MAGGAEFDAIRALIARWGDLAHGIGDDAAVLQSPPGEELVLSTDSSLELVHFREAWLTPEEIGARATAAALSDLAAMGARALAVLVSLQVPSAWRNRLAPLADGIGRVVRDADARIIGGNLTHGQQLGITLTVIGSAVRPVRRRGAAAGDALYVTGALGGPRAALLAWERGEEPAPFARARFASPVARLREGAWLAAAGAHAMIDVSDGLSADAGHLAAASGVICELWPDALPLAGPVTPGEALASGEEYELLVALDANLDPADFARRFGVSLTQVGSVRAVGADQVAGVVLAERERGGEGHGTNGGAGSDVPTKPAARVDLPAGHDHFSR